MKITLFSFLSAAAFILFAGGCGGNNNEVAAFDDVTLEADADLFATPPQPPVPPMGGDPDAVVIRVEGDEITRGDIMREVDMLMNRMRGQVPPQQMAAMRDEIIEGATEQLITRRLLLNQVQTDGVTVEDEEIDEIIAMFRGQLPPGASLEDQLLQTGMTFDELKDNLRQELAVNKMLEAKLADMMEPSEEDIVAFYELHVDEHFTGPEMVEASHILINTRDLEDEEIAAARQQLVDIREELLQGADFATLASTHSACPSGAQGGSLGRFPRGQMVPPFEEAAFTQELNEIGDIVETQFGFHIIKVTARHEAGVQPLEGVREDIAGFLSRQQRDTVVREYIQTIREAADVEYLEDL